MRPFLHTLPAAAAIIFLAGIPAEAAPHEYHTCPTEARAVVTHNGGDDWNATPQSSRLTGTRMGPIGGIVALICVYNMFGHDYWIFKRPSPDYVNCTPDARGFYCRPS
jgi:hypothetical protein